ncbi:MAG: hypothetical protein ABI679_15935 [Gemmatimonadota bacterium]
MLCKSVVNAVVLAACFNGLAFAQGAVPERRLTTADARFPQEFSSIRGVRELPDGRVMVADGIEEVLLVADLKTGKADTLGRAGQGPGEYKMPDALYPMAGGGTLLLDLGNGRLNFLGTDTKYRESAPIAQSNNEGMLVVLPRATDSQGRIYFQPFSGGAGRGIPDSASVVRWDRTRARFDTVARVKLPALNVQSSGGPNNQRQSMRPRPYPAQDIWAVAPDGRIVLVRASDYHLDIVGTDGRVTHGRPVTFSPVAIRDGDKRDWVAEQAGGLRVNMQNRNGQMSMAFSRGGQDDAEENAIAETEWPASKPPFVAAWVTPEGQVWVERSVPSGSARTIDVFDATGNLSSRVILPVGRRVAGFGAGVVYLRQADKDDLQWLERYRR